MPLLAATAVLLMVPRDQVARRRARDGEGPRAELEPFRMSRQFVLAVAALFSIYSMNELIRLVTPIALKAIQGSDNVAGESGLAFTLAGLMSATSVLLIAPRLFRPGRVSRTLGAACTLGACGFLILALTNAVPLYILGFLLVALVVSSMVPALNTLIAANVVRSRRGTGFGIAASVQALSFALGPLGAAFFAAVSLDLGFGLLAFLFFALGLVLFAAVREPRPQV